MSKAKKSAKMVTLVLMMLSLVFAIFQSMI